MISELQTTVGKLHVNFDHYMGCTLQGKADATGFTIGQGKKMYWYIVPHNGYFKCYPVEDKGGLGWPRQVNGQTRVTVKYRDN